MKAAWIGVLGAIIGALIGIFGTPIWSSIYDGPKEGVFSADYNCLTAGNIAQELRKQIDSYPCNLRIAHINGPTIEDLSFKLKSEYTISNLIVVRNDEGSRPILSELGKTLSFSTPKLRKKAVIDITFTSIGGTSFEKEVVMSKGSLVDEIVEINNFRKKEWYETDYFLVPLFIVLFVLFIIIAYLGIRKYIEPQLHKASNERIKTLAALAAVSVFIPIPFSGAISKLFIIYVLMIILLRSSQDDTEE